MKIHHILLTSTMFMIMSISLISCHHFYRFFESRRSYKNETFNDNEKIDTQDHSASDSDNPEIPYTVTKNYFIMGGFCMQWGRTYSDEIFFHFPFDKVFIGLGTVAKKTNKWENLKVQILENNRMHFNYGLGDAYWLAIGLKINPIDNII